MDRKNLLDRINLVPAARLRLNAFVKHGFSDAARELVVNLVASQTTGLWHERTSMTPRECVHFPVECPPEDELYKVVLFSHQTEKLEPTYADGGQAMDNINEIAVCPEWLRTSLGWSVKQVALLIAEACKQAVIRRVSNWNPHQWYGTVLASRIYLPTSDSHASLLKMVEAAQMSFAFRGSDFGNWGSHLKWPFFEPQSGPLRINADLINRIVDHFIECGWTTEQIKQEFYTWMRLCKSGSPSWVFAVASSKIFDDGDHLRSVALRKYFRRFMDEWLRHPCTHGDDFYVPISSLIGLGLSGRSDRRFFEELIIRALINEKMLAPAENFARNLGVKTELVPNSLEPTLAAFVRSMADRAIAQAHRENDYEAVVYLGAAADIKNELTEDARQFFTL